MDREDSAYPISVRRADLSGPDGERVSQFVEAYLRQTEVEKAAHLGDTRDDAIRLYCARGFETVTSWEERPRLVCMQLEPDLLSDFDG
ncbi:hypothetical protein [Agreia pratensis]|uniref:Uncharacterized protein n=1 Tax=Agreia pratensis TaxID=150121 RepID=A0A1X7KUY9_9MICO|nr:hypothetical protein [Agreia pratensis]SMG45372.1 hypothetical protein SAMN06296010_2987 [Agreia pratensis]